MTAARARSRRSADSVSPRWRSISMPESIIAIGLTLFWPLYLGAEPWVASNTATRSPRLAPGATPEPADEARPEVRDDVAVQVGQQQHVEVLRLLDELHAHVVDQELVVGDVVVLL